MPYQDFDEGEVDRVGAFFCFVVMAIIIAVVLFLSSCTYGDSKRAIALGGKGAYKGRDFAMNWDNEKSFSDGAIVAGLAIGAVQAVAAQRSSDAVTRSVDANRSAETINASNNALKATEVQAGVTKATTINPNVIPK